MADTVKLLLKFGEKQFIERLRDGHLYFNTAIRLRGIETELQIKGQGDQYEGKTIISGSRLTRGNGSVHNGILNFMFSLAPADKLPVFCLYTCFEKDCQQSSSGSWLPKLSSDVKDMVNEHFPKADAVAIINNPEQFIQDVQHKFGKGCKHGTVKYAPIADNIGFFNDMIHVENAGRVSSVYFSLLRKDTFFTKEQEYRFILSDMEIEEPKEMSVDLSPGNSITVQGLDEFFDSMK